MRERIHRIVAAVAVPRVTDPIVAPVVELARRTGAELHLVHVLPPIAVALASPHLGAAATVGGSTGAVAAARRQLRALATKLGTGGPVVCHVRAGSPSTVIAAVADSVTADLVVVGATRRGNLAGALFGTTAQAVLRQSPAPVLM